MPAKWKRFKNRGVSRQFRLTKTCRTKSSAKKRVKLWKEHDSSKNTAYRTVKNKSGSYSIYTAFKRG